MANEDALDNKEKRFVEEYLIDLDVNRAAIAAGYSKTMAITKCYQWVSDCKKKPHVYYAIQRGMEKRSERTKVSQDRVLLEIARLAFNDPRKMFNEKGVLLPVKDWPDEVAATISSIKVTEMKTSDDDVVCQLKEIKFWDKGKQIELAGKHLGMFTDKVEHTGKDGSQLMQKIIFEVVDGKPRPTD